MDILDRLLLHDADTTRSLLLLCRDLNDEQLDCYFDLGQQTLRETFSHMISNMEAWTDLLYERPQTLPQGSSVDQRSISGMLERLDRVAPQFAAIARKLQAEGRLDDSYEDYLDQPATRKSFGGTIVHLTSHSMSHRAEVLHLMGRLGVADLPEGDALSWEAGYLAQQEALAQASGGGAGSAPPAPSLPPLLPNAAR